MHKFLATMPVTIATLLCSASAFASDPLLAANGQTPAVDAKATDKPSAGEGKPVDTTPGETAREDMRFRFGFNGGAGFLLGDVGGPTLGFGVRAGLQVNRLFGAYLQSGGSVLIGASSGPNTSVSAIAFIPFSPMASITPIDQLEFAAGPSLDYYSGGSASTGGGGAAAGSTGAFAFGIAGRVALHLGGRDEHTGRRSGFTIGADVHPIFVGGGVTVVPVTIGLGGDWM